MRPQVWACAVVVLGLVSVVRAAEPEPRVISGRVETVTLYRGQALVTRVVPVEGAAGATEIVVGDLPEQVLPESLFAEAGEGLDVRAVRYRARAVGEAPREEVRRLDTEIQAAEDRIVQAKKQIELTTQRSAYLDKLEGFVAPTATAEMAKGVLNAEVLEKVTLFNFAQRKAAADEALKLGADVRDLEKQLALLRNQRNEVATGHAKTVREAVLFLDKRAAGRAEVKLNYLSGEAGWAPAYNFRATKDGKAVRLEYNALIHQRTGEDWTGVALILSTASPFIGAAGPVLAPFRVVLSRPGGEKEQASPQGLNAQYKSIQSRLNTSQMGMNRAIRQVDNGTFNWDLNTAANDYQVLELTNPKDVMRILKEEPGEEEGMSVTYALPGTVSLASRPDQQLVRITGTELASKFYYVATPVLTPYVYREAELTNTGADILLAGPVSAYLDGHFVGRGEITSVSRGQTFVVGFGADTQLRARRELVDKTDQLQGGNRELSFKYRLVIENYKDEAATVRVQDRIPFAERAMEIRVTLGELREKLSEEPLYLRNERPKGILRWDLEIPAKASAEKARLVEYGYKAEFDRNLTLSTRNAAEQQKELEEMRNARYKQ